MEKCFLDVQDRSKRQNSTLMTADEELIYEYSSKDMSKTLNESFLSVFTQRDQTFIPKCGLMREEVEKVRDATRTREIVLEERGRLKTSKLLSRN